MSGGDRRGRHSRFKLVKAHNLAALLYLCVCKTLGCLSLEPIFGANQRTLSGRGGGDGR